MVLSESCDVASSDASILPLPRSLCTISPPETPIHFIVSDMSEISHNVPGSIRCRAQELPDRVNAPSLGYNLSALDLNDIATELRYDSGDDSSNGF